MLKLPKVVDGIKTTNITKVDCSVCTKEIFTNNRNRKPDAKASAPLELVHTIGPTAQDGFKLVILFTDYFRGAVSAYFLENQSDTSSSLKTLHRTVVWCIRTDNGTEYTSDVFQSLIKDKGMRPDHTPTLPI